MSKIYVDDLGTTLLIDTNIDLTGTPGVTLEVKRPDDTLKEWDCAIESPASAGILSHKVGTGLDELAAATEWGQTGIWTFQAHVIFSATEDYLGETTTVSVFAAFA